MLRCCDGSKCTPESLQSDARIRRAGFVRRRHSALRTSRASCWLTTASPIASPGHAVCITPFERSVGHGVHDARVGRCSPVKPNL